MNWNKYSLFRLPKSYKRFEYTPRYYDEKKEERRKKLETMQLLSGDSENTPERQISFRQRTAGRHQHSDYKSQSLRSNLRLFVILAGVLVVFYILFKELYSAEALESLTK